MFARSGSVCIVTKSSILTWIQSLKGEFLNTAVLCKAVTNSWSLISEGIYSLTFTRTTYFVQAQLINKGNVLPWQYVLIVYKLGQVNKNTSILENLYEVLIFKRHEWGKENYHIIFSLLCYLNIMINSLSLKYPCLWLVMYDEFFFLSLPYP